MLSVLKPNQTGKELAALKKVLEVRDSKGRFVKGEKKPPRTETTRKRLSQANKGQIPWNKGKKNVYTDDQAETDRLWNAIIGNGGEASACGWCKDKWGLSWQITPRALTAAITDPDRAAAKRAFNAMMEMGKIDIAGIEAALRGLEAAENKVAAR